MYDKESSLLVPDYILKDFDIYNVHQQVSCCVIEMYEYWTLNQYTYKDWLKMDWYILFYSQAGIAEAGVHRFEHIFNTKKTKKIVLTYGKIAVSFVPETKSLEKVSEW